MAKPETAGCRRGCAVPLIMGIVNATPDSFYDRSRVASTDLAVERGLEMASQGADILDIGGQSTRPGSDPISFEEEKNRVIPVISALAKRAKNVKISVDTDKARIAEMALDAGATIINDVSALRADKGMVKTALRADKVVLMHMLGDSPKTMQTNPVYNDVFAEVSEFLAERIDSFLRAGGRKDQVWIDPGIGFGKNLDHNLTLIRRASEFSKLAPVVLGVSRKSFFSKINQDGGPQDRLTGSLAVAAYAALNGIGILRVHDVLETKKTLDVLKAVQVAP